MAEPRPAPVPGEEIDYESDLTPIIQQWTSVYAATEDVHDAARLDREVPAEKKVHTRGIEVGQIFYFGTKYSDAMKAKGGKWTFEDLNAFITSPKAFIEGTKMGFGGEPDAGKRADLIVYLRSVSDSPVALPAAN